MAENTGKENKDKGAVQGTGTHPENSPQQQTQSEPLEMEFDVPNPLQEMIDSNNAVLESNQAVIDSNNAVLEAIAQFNENAEKVVKDIISEAKAVGNPEKEQTATTTPAVEVKINKKAKYVVAKGRAFHSSVSGGQVGEGVDVSGLEPDRLKALIAQGIAVEDTED